MSDNHSHSVLYILEVFSPQHSCGVMIGTVSFREMVHEITLQVNKNAVGETGITGTWTLL